MFSTKITGMEEILEMSSANQILKTIKNMRNCSYKLDLEFGKGGLWFIKLDRTKKEDYDLWQEALKDTESKTVIEMLLNRFPNTHSMYRHFLNNKVDIDLYLDKYINEKEDKVDLISYRFSCNIGSSSHCLGYRKIYIEEIMGEYNIKDKNLH